MHGAVGIPFLLGGEDVNQYRGKRRPTQQQPSRL